ncbi:hypothetical protein MmiHf6_02590 [Methanimicrococcus hongohii]|uniref:Uncharacterized protein n=1 Tax=Methanimicrococcus hongohii TaxID=3028295 RepID=A0AA96V0F4_9EURY|nr:hypothetical protein [Methanimicrococcus sp. Hf6]WNY22965.1 hypothetical protein MmiHf6_02590 [Methanimicrococcus sp. Hf6]
MKQKLIIIIFLISVFFTGCLTLDNQSSNFSDTVENLNHTLKHDSLNPLDKNISPFESGGLYIVPRENVVWYETYINESQAVYSEEELISNSDLVFYGTIKEVRPSKWSTKSGQTPLRLYFAMPGIAGFGDEENYYEYKLVSLNGVNDFIYTDVIFEVDSLIKGVNSEEIVISVKGGQVGKFVMPGTYANPWDFKAGDAYLVYSHCRDNRNEIMEPGLFVINDVL